MRGSGDEENGRNQGAAEKALGPHAEEDRSANRALVFPRIGLGGDASGSMRAALTLRAARPPARVRRMRGGRALLRMRTPPTRRAAQCASSQLWAARASTASGTERDSAGI